VSLYGSDHGRLRFGRLIVMDNANASEELNDKGHATGERGIEMYRVKRRLTAIDMAILSSVTVSMGLLMKGVFRETLRVIWVSVMALEAGKSIFPGRRRKSL
jgi:hypothetical protein